MNLKFSDSAPSLARNIIGWTLIYSDETGVRGGIISETEAYTKDDKASHSYGGIRIRNIPMFSIPGTIYIYKIYGIHYCLNIVCGKSDGQAILIRALIPTVGIESMFERRKQSNIKRITNGPANTFQALGINPDLNNIHIKYTNLKLFPPSKHNLVRTSKRIGISKDVDKLWRFTLE